MWLEKITPALQLTTTKLYALHYNIIDMQMSGWSSGDFKRVGNKSDIFTQITDDGPEG